MKTDDYYDQLGEVIELREENILEGVRDIKIVRTRSGFYKVRFSIGDYMYFESPLVFSSETAKSILDNLKRRIR